MRIPADLRKPRWVLANYDTKNGPLLAQGLAFSLLLGAVPLLFFAVSLKGYLGNPRIQEYIAQQILDFLPTEIRVDFMAHLTELSDTWSGLPWLTVAIFVVASFNLFENLERVMSTMLGAERRRFLLGRAVSFLLLLGFIILFYVAALLTSVVRLGTEFVTSRPFLIQASARVVSGLLTAGILTGLYNLFSRARLRFLPTFGVAVACAIVWHLIGVLGGIVIRQAGARFVLYGAVASGVVVLIYLRLLAEIIVVSSSIVAAVAGPGELAGGNSDGRVGGEEGSMANDTVFDKILSKEIPSEKVYEDDVVYAFKDINPQAPVHVLVVPKHRMTSFVDFKSADVEVVGRFLKAIAHVAGELELEKDGYRIVFNTGTHGQQSVEYLHAHIIGGRQLSWPPG